MIKLVVSDFDGTLFRYNDKCLSAKTLSLIKEILDCGVNFCVSSGRTYNELKNYFGALSDSIYFTCCDGATTIKYGKVLYSRKIETEYIKPFFQKEADNFSFILHGSFENYSFGDIPRQADIFNCKKIRGLYDINEKIYKITSFGTMISLPVYSGLRIHWDGGIDCITQYVNRYCNKGVALSDLQTRLMLSKYETAMLGDRGNDVCMVRNSAVSFCVGETCRELYDLCSFSVDDGCKALEKIISMIKNG